MQKMPAAVATKPAPADRVASILSVRFTLSRRRQLDAIAARETAIPIRETVSSAAEECAILARA